MNALVNQVGGLLKHGPSQNNDACGSITDLVILRLRQLDQQLCDMVAHFHLLQDSSTIVCDCNIAIGGDENLVEATGAERALDEVRNGSGGENV
jgi:hypothetical protein